MFLDCPSDWKEFFHKLYSAEKFKKLSHEINALYDEMVCYPAKEQLLNAFFQCPFVGLKVVIIGQDPYHGPHQAHGLSFSVPIGIAHPPSLKNIFIELSNDLDCAYPISGDLSLWANQGVLLLNAALSVRAGEAGSHLKYWDSFTKSIVQGLNNDKRPIIFVLWGNFAQKYERFITEDRHRVLKSGHPSPLSANRGYWFGNKHFSQVNNILEQRSEKPINWLI
ncbi:uracil-DNA glycosylase [Flavobacteriaceae bacterium]|nr:uracil-DNA glycosylase [Flavobacteriaceae bacterium]